MNDSTFINDVAFITGWALDFVRAIHERNWLCKLILRLAMGKYAYRELFGLRKALEDNGWYPDFEYELKGMAYHKDKVGGL